MKNDVGVQATKVPGPSSSARELVVRRVNWKDIKETTEQQTARNFCDFNGMKSWKLETTEQNDPVDIRAKSADGQSVEEFQIVRLWEQAVWEKLNAKNAVNAVDRSYKDQEAIELFRKALERKGPKKYSADVRRNRILLIDANPIESASQFTAGIEGAIRAFAKVGYKSVWVVGTGDSRRID
jgi:hypothetical protein